jgi:hypothetical protein
MRESELRKTRAQDHPEVPFLISDSYMENLILLQSPNEIMKYVLKG